MPVNNDHHNKDIHYTLHPYTNLSAHEKENGAWSRTYSSTASLALMIARQLKREVERRDARSRP